MRTSRLYDKVHGYLMGGAIGDAFGIRTEMMHYRDIEAQYGHITHFDPLPWRRETAESPLELFNPFGPQMELEDGFHPLGKWSHDVGAYTDDTRYQLLAIQSIIRKRGPITGMDLAEEWLNYRLAAEGASDHKPTWRWPGPERAFARFNTHLPTLLSMAMGPRPCIPGWDGPMGLIHAGDPGAASAVGSPFSVAIASAMKPDATIHGVIADVLMFPGDPSVETDEFVGRMTRLVEIAATCSDVFDLREPFYREFLISFPPWEPVFALEMVPCAIALCLIADGDPRRAIVGATNLGRDADTIAGMAGQLAATLNGASSLPQEWLDKVSAANPDPNLADTAEALCSILVERAEMQVRNATDLLSLRSSIPSG